MFVLTVDAGSAGRYAAGAAFAPTSSPYHAVSDGRYRSRTRSTAPLFAFRIGAVPPGHTTFPGQVTVPLAPLAGCARNKSIFRARVRSLPKATVFAPFASRNACKSPDFRKIVAGNDVTSDPNSVHCDPPCTVSASPGLILPST